MTRVYAVRERVVVLRGDKFHECIVLPVKFNGIQVELHGSEVLVSFGDVGLHKEFITTPTSIGEIGFVLVDPSQKIEKQIVGIGEFADNSDDAVLGIIHLLK